MRRGGERLTENEKKKEYLCSYKNLCRKLQSLEEQLQSLREVEQSAKIQQLSDMPGGGLQKDLSDYIVKLDKVISRIIRTKADMNNRRLEIEDKIASMENGLESDVLRKRYLELKTWERIAEEVDYSVMGTYKIHGRALMHFTM